eukprot:GHVR01030960.1.p1 GENE.GHVR01030960.1~~GHVR01030960.1.p1  ORF type:complete len:419 (+),score=92.91 GHVR01030960.1:91-1347(+)
MTTWQPLQQDLDGVVQLFIDASSDNNDVQQKVLRQREDLRNHPDAPNYLVYVFVLRPDLQPYIRQAAGLELKNYIRIATNKDAFILAKEHVPRALIDPNKCIRNTAGSIITQYVLMWGVECWPEVMQHLFQAATEDRIEVVEAALSTLHKICQDETEQFRHYEGPFLEYCRSTLVPYLLDMAQAILPDKQKQTLIKQYAFMCLNFFSVQNAFSGDESLNCFLSRYWKALGEAATDTNSVIKKEVCTGMVSLAAHGTIESTILTQTHAVFGFVLEACRDPDPEVRQIALSFWKLVVRSGKCDDEIRNLLPNLLPLLLDNTRYSQQDFLNIDQSQLETDNAEVADTDADIAPRFHEHRYEETLGSPDDDEGDDDGNYGSAWGGQWTARKAAASALDMLAGVCVCVCVCVSILYRYIFCFL